MRRATRSFLWFQCGLWLAGISAKLVLSVEHADVLVPLFLAALFLASLAVLWRGQLDFQGRPGFGTALRGVLLGIAVCALCFGVGGCLLAMTMSPASIWLGSWICLGLSAALYFIEKRIRQSCVPEAVLPRLGRELHGLLAEAGLQARLELGERPAQFLLAGGSLDDFSDAEILRMLEAAPPDSAAALRDALPSQRAMALARQACGQGRLTAAAPLLTDKLVAAWTDLPGGGLDCLAAFQAAGLLHMFLTDRFAALPVASRDVIVSSLKSLDMHEEALGALRSLRELMPKDVAEVFELNLRCGHFDRARLLPGELAEGRPVARCPEYYYDLAKLCEDAGEKALARELYQVLAGSGRRFKDAPERLAKLGSTQG